MWTAPDLQELGSSGSDRLRSYVRPVDGGAHDRLPRWVPRHEFPTYPRCQAPQGPTECLASGIDRSHHLLRLKQVPAFGASRAELLCSCHFLPLRWGGAPQRGALRGAPTQLSAALLAVHNRRLAAPNAAGSVVMFAADHQLPGNASGFVGQRHRRELGRLALDQFHQPGRGMASPTLNLLDYGGGTGNQDAAQVLVAGACNDAEPRLAGGRVILGGKSEPGREVAARAESLRISDLHGEQRSPNRANGGDFHHPSAQFIALMPSHQLGLDLRNPDLQPGIFLAVAGKQ